MAVLGLRRELRRSDGKRFVPTGSITVSRADRYASIDPPERRHGTVPFAPGTDPDPTRVPADVGDSESDRLLSYVPPAVQRDVRSVVPDPTYSHGRLVQWSTGDAAIPYKQTLCLVRLRAAVHAAEAVVLAAVREVDAVSPSAGAAVGQRVLSRLPWTVTRYVYHLDQPWTSTEASRGAALPDR